MRRIQSVEEVLQVLYPAWERYGVTQQAVANWRSRERIPASYYIEMVKDLEKRNCRADPSLWRVNGRRRHG